MEMASRVMMLMAGLLIINPEWLDLRWAWDLNGFDARIIAAWFMGWAVWAGTIAFAHDWDEVRLAGALGILFGKEADGLAWLRGPHAAPVFGGRPPMALLASGSLDALLTVRRFLDAARGGIYAQPNAADRDFAPYTDADIVFR